MVLGNSKVTSQALQIFTALAHGKKLKKGENAVHPLLSKVLTPNAAALAAGITVKVISYGQMLMTGHGVLSVADSV